MSEPVLKPVESRYFWIPATDNTLKMASHELPAPPVPYQAGTILKIVGYYEVQPAATLKPIGGGVAYVQEVRPDLARENAVTIADVLPPRQATLPGVWEGDLA